MDHLLAELEKLDHQALRRQTIAWPAAGAKIPLPNGRVLLNFSSNDYLNLAQDPMVKQGAIKAVEQWGCSASASRLMCGTLHLHEVLETALARLAGREAALVFSSGFGMNVGVIEALAGRNDILFTDRLVHASLVDGARLSGAKVRRWAHNDLDALQKMLETTPADGAHRWIVCESVYSMDGDIAPLEEIAGLAARFDAGLIVDEAHAIGVWNQGAGVGSSLWTSANVKGITLGTLGKALGSLGGFSASSTSIRDFLVNRARSFIFATALPPASLGAALAAVEQVTAKPELGTDLLTRARIFHGQLEAQGLRLPPWRSQIIPVLVGDNAKALEFACRLRESSDMLVTAIRPPTVPQGTARLRLSVTLGHTPEDLTEAAVQIGKVAREIGVVS